MPMNTKRIIQAGNSSAITISDHELAHLGVCRGDQIIITQAKPDRLIIRAYDRWRSNQITKQRPN